MTQNPTDRPVVYPETDGRPMPDGEYQSVTWRYLVAALKNHFRGRGVYAAGDLFVYLEEGNPRNCIAPDLFVVVGAGDHLRDTYKVWEEPGGLPDFVLEIVSPSTWRQDLGSKRERYASLGVTEYWLHDPHARHLRPPLATGSSTGSTKRFPRATPCGVRRFAAMCWDSSSAWTASGCASSIRPGSVSCAPTKNPRRVSKKRRRVSRSWSGR